MPRIIEIVLFLTPFLGFATWRLLFPSPVPPLWLTGGFVALAAVMLLALLWLRYTDTGDTAQTYVPARLQDGVVMPTQQAPRP
jgi:hypothetical protein